MGSQLSTGATSLFHGIEVWFAPITACPNPTNNFAMSGIILDLALAISQLKGNTKYSVPLVVFGHMHKELAFGNGPRKMIVVGDDNTIYLNGAIVPRVKRFPDNPLPENQKHTLRAFTLIDSKEGKLEKIAETWVSVIGDNTSFEEEHILFNSNMLNTSNV